MNRRKAMPIKVPANLPALEILQNENVFIMDEERALHQDIRPLKIVILNLMPNKSVTETQLLRLLANTPLQVEVTLLHPQTHQSKNTPAEYLKRFYTTFDQIKHDKFDGMIITGAPVEQIEYEEVDYWDELTAIMAWTVTNVFPPISAGLPKRLSAIILINIRWRKNYSASLNSDRSAFSRQLSRI